MKTKNYMNEIEDLVSIIVPVYNVYNYLDQCMESLVSQTYKDIEIILINDGSPDESEEKCLLWKKRDKRIIYISKENEKLGPTRTLGIKVASGRYVMFVDSDDWVDKSYVEKLYLSVKSNNADFAFCDVYDVIDGKYISILSGDNISTTTSFQKEPSILYSIRPAMWNKIYKKSLFIEHNISIPPYESEEFCVFPALIYYAKRISQVKEPLYYYRKNRVGNIVTTGIGMCCSFPLVVEHTCQYAKEQGIWNELKFYLKPHFTRQFLFAFYQNTVEKKYKSCVTQELLNKAYQAMKKYYPEWKKELFSEEKYILFGNPQLRNSIQFWNMVASFFSEIYLLRYNFSSIISIFATESYLKEYNIQEENCYRNEMIRKEVNKTLLQEIRQGKDKYFIFDFLEERYDIWYYKEEYITLNPMNMNVYKQLKEGQVIKRESQEMKKLWIKSCNCFIRLLKEYINLDKIILIENYAQEDMRDYGTDLGVETVNRILSEYYDFTCENLLGIKRIKNKNGIGEK